MGSWPIRFHQTQISIAAVFGLGVGSWPSGPMAHLDGRKGPFWTIQHQMYNVQIMDHFYYEYRCIITIILFSDEAHDMNQV